MSCGQRVVRRGIDVVRRERVVVIRGSAIVFVTGRSVFVPSATAIPRRDGVRSACRVVIRGRVTVFDGCPTVSRGRRVVSHGGVPRRARSVLDSANALQYSPVALL